MESFVVGSYQVDLIDEVTYTPRSADNVRTYSFEYALCDGRPSSMHGVICRRGEQVLGSAVLLAGGGSSSVHRYSLLAMGQRVYAAVGDQVACLDVPALGLVWHTTSDEATVFGVHTTTHREALIVHGELAVSRLSLDGEITWCAGGADIFTGELRVEEDAVLVHDLEDREYRFDILSGRLTAS